MARTNAGAQRDVLGVLGVREGERVLEVGYGPGVLLGQLAQAGASLVAGVDPSEEMLHQAERRNRAAVRDGRVEARLGEAVGLWEIRRVLRPGGTVAIAGTAAVAQPHRRLPGLSEDQLEAVRRDLAARFEDVRRYDRRHVVVFVARRPVTE